jgi:hypothetical protein
MFVESPPGSMAEPGTDDGAVTCVTTDKTRLTIV